jgi:hypothetical protein
MDKRGGGGEAKLMADSLEGIRVKFLSLSGAVLIFNVYHIINCMTTSRVENSAHVVFC